MSNTCKNEKKEGKTRFKVVHACQVCRAVFQVSPHAEGPRSSDGWSSWGRTPHLSCPSPLSDSPVPASSATREMLYCKVWNSFPQVDSKTSGVAHNMKNAQNCDSIIVTEPVYKCRKFTYTGCNISFHKYFQR